MHIPPGYALFIPSAIRKAVDLPVVGVGPVQGPAPGRAGARPRATATWSAWCGARSPTPTSPPRPASGHTDDDPPVPVVQPGVRRAHGPQPLARLHREPAHRPRGRGRRRTVAPDVPGPQAGPGGRRRAGRAAGRHRRGPQRPPSSRSASATPSAGGQVRLAASVPNRAEFGDLVRNQLAECRRLGVDDRVRRRGRRAEAGRRARRRPRDRGHRRRVRPGRGGRRRDADRRGRRARRARRRASQPERRRWW